MAQYLGLKVCNKVAMCIKLYSGFLNIAKSLRIHNQSRVRVIENNKEAMHNILALRRETVSVILV